MNDTSGNAGHSPLRELSGDSLESEVLDPVIEVFKKDVDRTLLIENLRRTFHERAQRMNEFNKARETLRAARAPRAGEGEL